MGSGLNEVQFPEELQLGDDALAGRTHCLNEVQFPEELQLDGWFEARETAWPQ